MTPPCQKNQMEARSGSDRSLSGECRLKREIRDCGQHSSNSPGYGFAISRNRRWLCGSRTGSAAMAAFSRRRPSWRWLWLRNQPQSALALWFKDRVCRNGGRLKKTTIVALARQLLAVLWKYVAAGVVIEGAIVKSA